MNKPSQTLFAWRIHPKFIYSMGVILISTLTYSCKKSEFASGNDNHVSIRTAGMSNLSVDAVIPNSGSGGQQIQIFGYGFGNNPYKVSVSFGNTSAPVISVNPSQIVAVVPSKAQTGHVTISVGDTILKSDLIFISQEH